MRNLSALLLVLLLCSLHLVSGAPHVNDPDCCERLTTVKIPLKLVESYRWTDKDCPLKAIVFNTIKGREFCVNPDSVWISSHVEALDNFLNNKQQDYTTHTTPSVTEHL